MFPMPTGRSRPARRIPFFTRPSRWTTRSSKKDFKAAVSEYRTELMLLPPDATKVAGPGLADTLQLAEAYAKPDAKDVLQAIWFYARAWNFAPPAYKAQIEPKLEYYYKKYHGGLDGLDAIKAQAAATLFPPATYTIAPAPTPADLAHKAVMETPDLTTLNLEDKEFILANGSKDDAGEALGALAGPGNAGTGNCARRDRFGDQGCRHAGRQGCQDSGLHRQYEDAAAG